MDIGGPISRTVEDCALTLQAIAGHDPQDPHSARVAVPDYQAMLGQADLRGIRVGVLRDAIDADYINPQVKTLVSSAVASLGEMGATLEEVSIPLMDRAAAVTRAVLAVESASLHHQWIRTRIGDYDRNVQIDFLTGALLPAQIYYRAQKIRDLIRRSTLDLLQRFDVLALPSSSEPAPIIPTQAGLDNKEQAVQRMAGRRSLTGVFNLANVPALSVPCGFATIDGKDLPVGLQLAGRPFQDGLLLQVAHAYEQQAGWHQRRPPI